MSDWDRGTRPDPVPQKKEPNWRDRYHKRRRSKCIYCQQKVKGWRKIDGKARLCNEDGSIHICPNAIRERTDLCKEIRKNPLFRSVPDLSRLTDEEINDTVLVSNSIWRLEDIEVRYWWERESDRFNIGIKGTVPIGRTTLTNSRPKQNIDFKFLFAPLRIGASDHEVLLPIRHKRVVQSATAPTPRAANLFQANNIEEVAFQTYNSGWEFETVCAIWRQQIYSLTGSFNMDALDVFMRRESEEKKLKLLLQAGGFMP